MPVGETFGHRDPEKAGRSSACTSRATRARTYSDPTLFPEQGGNALNKKSLGVALIGPFLFYILCYNYTFADLCCGESLENIRRNSAEAAPARRLWARKASLREQSEDLIGCARVVRGWHALPAPGFSWSSVPKQFPKPSQIRDGRSTEGSESG